MNQTMNQKQVDEAECNMPPSKEWETIASESKTDYKNGGTITLKYEPTREMLTQRIAALQNENQDQHERIFELQDNVIRLTLEAGRMKQELESHNKSSCRKEIELAEALTANSKAQIELAQTKETNLALKAECIGLGNNLDETKAWAEVSSQTIQNLREACEKHVKDYDNLNTEFELKQTHLLSAEAEIKRLKQQLFSRQMEYNNLLEKQQNEPVKPSDIVRSLTADVFKP